MENVNIINIKLFLDTSWNTITDYFINNEININKDDNYKIKLSKFLLKYKRIIGLVLLIILLIIGYYEYYYNIITANIKNDNYSIQIGGGEAPAISTTSTPATDAPIELTKEQMKIQSKQQKKDAKRTKRAAKVLKTANSIKQMVKPKNIAKGAYNLGASGANIIREKSNWIYGVLYSVALSLVICIITAPMIVFFIVGIICFFLLKDKIKYLKAL